MGWSDVAFLTDGAANNALANREVEPRGANHLECSGESVMIRFKISITSLQPMSDTIPSHCRVPRFAGNKEIIFEENAVPDPGPGELLLRVRANALCGSERSQFFDGAPVTPGHEAAGTWSPLDRIRIRRREPPERCSLWTSVANAAHANWVIQTNAFTSVRIWDSTGTAGTANMS